MKLSKLRAFMEDDSGATAIEYGLIAGLVSVAAIIALGNLGTDLNNIFEFVSQALNEASSGIGASGEAAGGDTTTAPAGG